jgi:hypothetical protein
MSKVDEALAEVDAALVAMAPAHEGLRDYATLDIHEDTKAQVQIGIGIYDQRFSLLNEAKRVLENLLADTYPALVIPPVDAAVLLDLQENKATIDAALSKFTPLSPEAVTVGIVPGVPEPQTP